MHDHDSNAPPIPLLGNVALWLAVSTACILPYMFHTHLSQFLCFLEPSCNLKLMIARVE